MGTESTRSLQARQALLEAADTAFDDGAFHQALGRYRDLVSAHPDDVPARMGEALCLVHLGRLDEALPCLTHLELLMPASDQLQFMLGDTLFRTGREQEAIQRLEALVSRSPAYVDAWNRLGRFYLDREQYPDANRCFSAVLALDPDHLEALCCMGLMMIKFCQFDNATTVLHRALNIDPANILALNNLGRACKMMGRHEEALAWFKKALEIAPESTCIIDNYLFSMIYCPDIDPRIVAQEHFRLGIYDPLNVDPVLNFEYPSHERMRIGYVSADFYTHSVTYFFEPILKYHDYSKYEIFCYSLGATNDGTTARLKDLSCHWRDMARVSTAALAQQIREDRIDILVDLAGRTAENRLAVFANRSALTQLSWLGYPNTSGLKEMDYYLSDNYCDPPGMTDHLFSEQVWRLPRVFCCYLPPMEFPPIVPSPCLTNGFVTFGSFNNFAKVTTSMIRLWARLLGNVPDSRLYLKSMALGDRSVHEAVLAAFAAEGIDGERIQMRTVTSTPLEHLEEYGRVDIALDTFPYHGTTTTCEALWMGTPVITLAGTTHASRVGVSLLRQVGFTHGIAESADEYLARAIALASDMPTLALLRNRLRGMMATSALMDYAGITREVEHAFTAMYGANSRKGSAGA